MTTPTPNSTKPGERAHSLPHRAALRTIGRLQGGYRKDVPGAVAAVARLRREAGRDVYASPTGWGLDDLAALTELREEERQPQDQQTSPDAPPRRPAWHELRDEREDRAVHLAVTLWALHQQSIRNDPMHVSGWSLGRAVRRLAHSRTGERDLPSDQDRAAEPVEDASPAIRKRFVRIGTSGDFDILSSRLREMVLLLRSARIPLDYGLLADQLTRWQDEARQGDVRRAWGRDFHRVYARTTADEAEENAPHAAATDLTNEDAGD